jgi:hypothetical protein
MRFAGEFRFGGALKGGLNESLALGAPNKAPARNVARSPGELVKGEGIVEVVR